MRLPALLLVVWLAFMCPIALAEDNYPLDGHNWMVEEVRISEDHWISREEWVFENEADGTHTIDVVKVCRTSDAPIILEVGVAVTMDARQFTVLTSEDADSVSGKHGYCSVSVRRGTYEYKVSKDGNTVTVRTPDKTIHKWTRHEPQPEYYDESQPPVGTPTPIACPAKPTESTPGSTENQ